MLTISGQRIDLRDHHPNDLEGFHAWLSDPIVTQYLSWRTTTLEESFLRLADAIRENERQPRTKYFLAMVLKSGVLIGEAGFTIESRSVTGGIANLGYFLCKPYWGQGYASEALGLMIAYCFTTLGLHKVTADCDAENRASEKVMQRCGMVREAYRRKHALLDGEWRDRLEYALLREEWISSQ
jgi:ribosomal-protein-alanine N-acetyltransferase